MPSVAVPDPRPELFGSLFVLVQHLSRRLDVALEPLGLTSRQWLLLAVLERWFAGLSPSLTEAAARYGTSRQNVKQIALGLARLGYVRLVADPVDRRTTRLAVTDKVGVFAEPAVAAAGKALLDSVFAGITAAQVAQLRALVVDLLVGVARQTEVAATDDGSTTKQPAQEE